MESISIFPQPPGYSRLFDKEVETEQPPIEPPEPIEGQYVIFGELQEV